MASFTDDFNRADSTNLGANWTEDAQDMAIASNRLVNNTTNKSGHVSTATGFTPADADYLIQAIVQIKNVGGNISATGVIGRMTDTTHFYMCRTVTTGLQLYKFNGGATLLGSYATTINLGTDYTVKLTMEGTALKGYLDGTERISTTDSDLSSVGLGGVRMFPDNTGPSVSVGDSIVDDFYVDDELVAAVLSPIMTTNTKFWGPV